MAPRNGMDIRVISKDIAAVAAAVRAAGSDRTIVNEMAKEIRRAARPIRPEVRANAVAVLPHRGGLGAWVARAAVRVSVKRSGRSAGVSLVGTRNKAGKKANLRAIDDGTVRAPNYGRRHGPWHDQTVHAGFMTEVVERHRDQFRAAIVDAVDGAMRKVGL